MKKLNLCGIVKLSMVCFFITFYPSNTFSQNVLQGKVTDANGTPLPFAHVYLTDLEDTSDIKASGLTDLNGAFILNIKECAKVRHYIFVTSMGWKTIKDDLPLQYITDDLTVKIEMEERINQLSEVTVQESAVAHDMEKSVYTLSKQERKRAQTSLSLLNTIPVLNVNTANNTVSTHFGKGVKILLNGRNSSDKEILALPQNEIVKIEHYHFPPARFADNNLAEVINVITRDNVEGGTVYTSLTNAINTGYNDDMLFLKYNKSNTELRGRYYFSRRNYNEKLKNNASEHMFNNNLYQENLISEKYNFGYIIQEGNLTLSNKKDNDYLFSFDVKPFYVNSYDYPVYRISDKINSQEQTATGETSSLSTTKKLSADFYFQKYLPKQNEFLLNVVANYFEAAADYENLSVFEAGDTLLYDYLVNDNNKKSLIGELQHSKKFEKVKLNTGVKTTVGELNQTINNKNNLDVITINTFDNYVFTELIGKVKSLAYQVSLGLIHHQITSTGKQSEYNYVSLLPRIQFSWPIKAFHIKSYYKITTTNPALSNLNNHQILGRNFLVTQGNPDIVPYKTHDVSISMNYRHKKLTTGFEVQYSHSNNPLLKQYVSTNNYLAYTINNEAWRKEGSFSVYLKLKLLKDDKLSFTVYGAAYGFKNKYHNLPGISLVSPYFNSSISYNYKKWSFTTDYSTGLKKLRHQTIQKNPDNSSIYASYRINNWTLGAGVLFPLSKSYRTEYETVDESLVQESRMVDIYDSSQIVYLRLKYRFSFGKSYKTSKKLQNSDNDSGVIKTH